MNIATILKDIPKGTELYSPIFGKCVFDHVTPAQIIVVKYKGADLEFNKEGHFGVNNEGGECLLFLSDSERSWEQHVIFNPFDKIVARHNGESFWSADFYSHPAPLAKGWHIGIGGSTYNEVLPYNEETKRLLGTKNSCKTLAF